MATTPLAQHMKSAVFILAIIVLYIPMVQLGTTTIFPREPYPMFTKDCYAPYRDPAVMTETERATQAACIDEQRAQELAYQARTQKEDTWRFVLASVVSFITVVLVAFVAFPAVINYGLFAGAVLNTLFSLRFAVDKSLVGLIILFLLFVVSIVFISRQQKEGAANKTASIGKCKK